MLVLIVFEGWHFASWYQLLGMSLYQPEKRSVGARFQVLSQIIEFICKLHFHFLRNIL